MSQIWLRYRGYRGRSFRFVRTRLADLASGRRHTTHADLLDHDELDGGYRIVTTHP
jgi:hypothetical protein